LAEENEVQAQFGETHAATIGQTGPSQLDFDVDVGVDVEMEPPPTSQLTRSKHNSNQSSDRVDPFDEDEDMWDMINEVHAN